MIFSKLIIITILFIYQINQQITTHILQHTTRTRLLDRPNTITITSLLLSIIYNREYQYQIKEKKRKTTKGLHRDGGNLLRVSR